MTAGYLPTPGRQRLAGADAAGPWGRHESAAGVPGGYVVAPVWQRLCEGADPISEAELSRIWAAQSFPAAALTLADGRRLRVLMPGRPGGGAGPDYRDAVVAIDGEERRGDVELHVRASSFYAHGHHLDAAYDHVVLHVVYAADDGAFTRLHSGALTPVASFAEWVGGRTEELRRWLEAQPLWLEPCSGAAARLGREGVLAVLEQEGEARLGRRRSRLAEAIANQGEEDALWLALLDVLGYGPDRASWRRLAELLPPRLLRNVAAGGGDVLEALLAVAGLAPLLQTAAPLPRPLLSPLSGGARPASRPQRRLAALAALWQRAGGDLPSFARRSVAGAGSAAELARAWSIADPQGGPALLGGQRAGELLLNAVLPFAALDPSLSQRARELSARLPVAPAYGKTAFLEASIRRGDAALRPRTALQQQGLLALAADWCRQGGCGRCPLS